MLLTKLAVDSSPPSCAAASSGDVVTRGSILTLTGLNALLPEMTFWASYPHKAHMVIKSNTFSVNVNCSCICSKQIRHFETLFAAHIL